MKTLKRILVLLFCSMFIASLVLTIISCFTDDKTAITLQTIAMAGILLHGILLITYIFIDRKGEE